MGVQRVRCNHTGRHRSVLGREEEVQVQEAGRSPLTQIAAVVVAAWSERGVEVPDDPSMLYNVDEAGDLVKDEGKQRLPHTKQLR